ncbi:hypothetical protein GCM10023149_00110 [Mucilaginibacter gynuensis]|uniref:Lipocalin-like domain-containing protein n=1 Tax=Mucilaginibacter gynuensis TaxID=1302236 RepID=A0ABP8FLR6_9SPHI
MRLSNLLIIPVVLSACSRPSSQNDQPILGTWRLVTAKNITKGDTVTTFPVAGQEMIKMFNNERFSFFKHDLKQGKDTANANFESGNGTYKLTGQDYSEHLEYCNYREWENHDFKFTVSIKNDTLIQKGIERIDSLNVNREIVETYVRLK